MRPFSARKARTIAVLSSIAAIGGGATAYASTGHDAHSSHRALRAHAGAVGGAGCVMPDLTAGERTTLAAVQKALQADAVSVAKPILDSEVSAGTITSTQETALLALVQSGPSAGAMPSAPPQGRAPSSTPAGPAGLTAGEQTALAAVQSALRAKVSSVATPILDDAVSAGTITTDQSSTLLGLLEQSQLHGPAAGPPAMGPGASSSSS